jgi:acetoacetyl-CoA synthetase
MPLFVTMKPGFELTNDIRDGINKRLRQDYSPRHVPDKIYAIEAVPYTLTGKKLEVPVRKILMGWTPEKAASRDAMSNPASLDYFIDFALTSTDYQWRDAK